MKLVTSSNKEINIKSISVETNIEELKAMATIVFEPTSNDAVSILTEYKAGGFNSFTVVNGETVKSYVGYVDIVNIRDRLDDIENSLSLTLKTK